MVLDCCNFGMDSPRQVHRSQHILDEWSIRPIEGVKRSSSGKAI